MKASELSPNVKNWRRHPKWQYDGMKAVLESVGYAGALIAYENNGQLILIDGHLRQEMTPNEEVPVLILDVNEQEADILLATYDPLTAMASEEGVILRQLLDSINTEGDEINTLLQDINEKYSASAVMEVENITEAYYLPNETTMRAVPTDATGQIYKAFLVHLPQGDYDTLMENIFKLGDRWELDTVAAILQKAIRDMAGE